MKQMRTAIEMALLLLLPTVSFAQRDTTHHSRFGAIVGKVTSNRDGQPLVGATVYLEDSYQGCQTKDSGFYSITGIPAGTYKLSASLIAFVKQTRENVVVRPHDSVRIDFRLADMCESWADDARRDIAASKVRILLGGFIVFNIPRNEVDKLTRKYGFEYQVRGNASVCEVDYNAVVEEYLNSRNGADWRKRFDAEWDEIARRYR